MRKVSETLCRDQDKHFWFNNFFDENRAVYAVMWKNTVDPGRHEKRIWRMLIAWCTPKSTNTLRICNTYWFSTATLVAWTRLNVTLYVHCLCWV